MTSIIIIVLNITATDTFIHILDVCGIKLYMTSSA